jgi:DNA-binding response OmpR family regulator
MEERICYLNANNRVNVDVLVSKLRKKLSDDSSIKFINVHGRDYKFIIEQLPPQTLFG